MNFGGFLVFQLITVGGAALNISLGDARSISQVGDGVIHVLVVGFEVPLETSKPILFGQSNTPKECDFDTKKVLTACIYSRASIILIPRVHVGAVY